MQAGRQMWAGSPSDPQLTEELRCGLKLSSSFKQEARGSQGSHHMRTGLIWLHTLAYTNLSLALGGSRRFANCQTNRPHFFLLCSQRSRVAREIYYSGEREEQRRSRCRRAGCRRRSSPEIYGCQAFTAAVCVCVSANHLKVDMY